ncbi:MAG: hypothetical protein ACRDJ4_14470 [Actinomycetota bacterium]
MRGAHQDPRRIPFIENLLEIDLRGCEFIRPAAVLWCLIYPLLARARGSTCRVLVPESMGVTLYLKSLGFFQILHDDHIEADDRDIRVRHDSRVVLPITKFSTQNEVDEIGNQVASSLSDSRMGAANLYSAVSEIFSEIALNAAEHAESGIGALGFIQFYEFQEGHRFICAVADGGIGIKRSLEKNPVYANSFFYDHDAIERAIEERVSGTGLSTRGIGLHGVSEDMKLPGRNLIIHSGKGSLKIEGGIQRRARRVNLFPGTLVYASIPT